MRKCIFLDRDGVLNEELGYQVTQLQEFKVNQEVSNALPRFKKHGFLLVVITNQSGIAKGSYDEHFVLKCHAEIQKTCGGVIDDLFYAPGYDAISKSLSRKPGSLLFERAIAKHKIDISKSWMIGDRETDMIPAKGLGISTVLLSNARKPESADYQVANLLEAVNTILENAE